MIRRRDLIIAAACLASTGAAYALEPRRRISLVRDTKLDDIIPRQVGDWSSRDVSDLVQPREPDSLASRLYGETVGRVYRQSSTGVEIMMLAAHGDAETNELQLHRPESCYPAVGFRITANQPVRLPLSPGVLLPGRKLVAEAPGRRESIVYWSRLGEYLPIDSMEQRIDRIRTALRGIVSDGLLMRFSAVGPDPAGLFPRLESFIPPLVHAVRPDQRPALIGTELANALV